MLTNSVPRPDGKPCTKISSDLWGNEILNGGLPPVSPTLLVEGHGVLPLSVLLLPGIVPSERPLENLRPLPLTVSLPLQYLTAVYR